MQAAFFASTRIALKSTQLLDAEHLMLPLSVCGFWSLPGLRKYV